MAAFRVFTGAGALVEWRKSSVAGALRARASPQTAQECSENMRDEALRKYAKPLNRANASAALRRFYVRWFVRFKSGRPEGRAGRWASIGRAHFLRAARLLLNPGTN